MVGIGLSDEIEMITRNKIHKIEKKDRGSTEEEKRMQNGRKAARLTTGLVSRTIPSRTRKRSYRAP